MQRIRIFAAGSAVILALALTAAGAVARTSDQTGGPVALAGLKPPPEMTSHATKSIVHAKVAHKTSRVTAANKRLTRTKLASNKKHDAIAAATPDVPSAAPTPAALPDNVWRTPAATPPADVTATTQPETAPTDNAPAPSALVVGGQTVQVAAPDQINEIDFAAHDASAAATTATPTDVADAMPARQTAFAAPAHRDADAVGSASWLAQVLAAFGGAAAAGAVAWFLIGSGPVRIYG
jgi:hypothetical protein